MLQVFHPPFHSEWHCRLFFSLAKKVVSSRQYIFSILVGSHSNGHDETRKKKRKTGASTKSCCHYGGKRRFWRQIDVALLHVLAILAPDLIDPRASSDTRTRRKAVHLPPQNIRKGPEKHARERQGKKRIDDTFFKCSHVVGKNKRRHVYSGWSKRRPCDSTPGR